MTTTHNRIDWNSVRERLQRFQLQDCSPGIDNRERLGEVFHRRAERLAARGREDATPAKQESFVVFRLAEHRFGIALANVKQVFRQVAITPVPGADNLLFGVANLNGSIRSVVDLRALANLSTVEADGGYILLLRTSGTILGIWAEAIDGVSQIDFTRISAVDDATSESVGSIAMGMTKDSILLLDATRLIKQVAERRRQHASNEVAMIECA